MDKDILEEKKIHPNIQQCVACTRKQMMMPE
jgi:hypothetical protein